MSKLSTLELAAIAEGAASAVQPSGFIAKILDALFGGRERHAK